MAKKQKNTNSAPKSNGSDRKNNPYALNTDAVDRLVTADEKSYPKLTIENDPRKKYKGGFLDRVPTWIKALFMKFWFNGAVCFFIFWGFGMYIKSMADMIIILAVVLGMVTDILVNNAFRFFATVEGSLDGWMMFPKKRFINFFLNIIYAFAVLLCVIWIYNVVNVLLNNISGTEGEIKLGVEPILFGVFYVVVDMCLISIKNMVVSIVSDAKKKNGID